MFKNQDYRLRMWMDDHLPKDKETFSRDAVEILLHLLWETAKGAEASDAKERERADKYGDF